MARQLILDLTGDPAHGRADFLVAEANKLAIETLDAPDDWPQGRMLLIGEAGSGKSHMANFWSLENGAERYPAATLRVDSMDMLVQEDGALVVEDAQRVGGAAGAEQALFHLWNLSEARGCLLLLTARTPPRDWGMVLPDLRSRMDAMPQTRIAGPDEGLLAAVLIKLFADRQINAPPGLIDWLARQMDRDLGLARRLVDALDRAALADRRSLTRNLAAELLDNLAGLDA